MKQKIKKIKKGWSSDHQSPTKSFPPLSKVREGSGMNIMADSSPQVITTRRKARRRRRKLMKVLVSHLHEITKRESWRRAMEAILSKFVVLANRHEPEYANHSKHREEEKKTQTNNTQSINGGNREDLHLCLPFDVSIEWMY